MERLASLISPPNAEEEKEGAKEEQDGDAEEEQEDEGEEEEDDSDDGEDFDPNAASGSDEDEEGMPNLAAGGAGVDVNAKDREGLRPVHVALLYGALDCLKTLIDAGAMTYVTLEGSPLLHIACTMSGFEQHEAFAIEAVKALLPEVENHCVQDDYGRTALSVAAQHGVLALVKTLVEGFVAPNEEDDVQVYINLRDKSRNRPLHWAASYGHADVVAYLLDNGAETDVKNENKDNALHCAVKGGNVECVERLLKAKSALAKERNAQGQTAADVASARGLVDIAKIFKVSVSDAADENLKRVIIAPDTCFWHHSCPPITRGGEDPPPENVNRLNVLLNGTNGTLRGKDFKSVEYVNNVQQAAWVDVLRCHDYAYLKKVKLACAILPRIARNPRAIGTIDGDTAVCSESFEAALAAAGATIEAVERIVSGDTKKVFCAVRPPGHHAGPLGPVGTPREPLGTGSHGFCLINNVAVAAAYARCVHRKKIRRVALVDFDVHHGNGTEACVQATAPSRPEFRFSLPIGVGTLQMDSYRPWLDETDGREIMFASVHGYGRRDRPFNFYPGTGPTKNTRVESDIDEDPQWGEDGIIKDAIRVDEEREYGSGVIDEQPWVVDVGMEGTGKKSERGAAWRRVWKGKILPGLDAFKPDLIIISAGFDAHAKDDIQGPVNLGVKELDYEWLTTELVKIANAHAHGRVISVLEGGYRIQGGPVSAFGRSVAAHVRALFQPNAEKYDAESSRAELNAELRVRREIRERREAEAEAEHKAFLERIAAAEGAREETETETGIAADDDRKRSAPDAETETAPPESAEPTPSKRRRGAPVDYAALNAKIEAEAAAKRAANADASDAMEQ